MAGLLPEMKFPKFSTVPKDISPFFPPKFVKSEEKQLSLEQIEELITNICDKGVDDINLFAAAYPELKSSYKNENVNTFYNKFGSFRYQSASSADVPVSCADRALDSNMVAFLTGGNPELTLRLISKLIENNNDNGNSRKLLSLSSTLEANQRFTIFVNALEQYQLASLESKELAKRIRDGIVNSIVPFLGLWYKPHKDIYRIYYSFLDEVRKSADQMPESFEYFLNLSVGLGNQEISSASLKQQAIYEEQMEE